MARTSFRKFRHKCNTNVALVARQDNERLVCIAAIPRGEVGSYVRIMRQPGFYKQVKIVYRRHRVFFRRNPLADAILGD